MVCVMGLAAAIINWQVVIVTDKRHHEMQRATLITQTPRLYMLSAMARELQPLQDLASMMDSLAKKRRPTASGPDYLHSPRCADFKSGFQT